MVTGRRVAAVLVVLLHDASVSIASTATDSIGRRPLLTDDSVRVAVQRRGAAGADELAKASFCSRKEADMQAAELLGPLDGDAAGAMDVCEGGTWLQDLRGHAQGLSGELTFLQLGCNDGYTAVQVFNAFAGETAVTPSALRTALRAAGRDSCGRCGECNRPVQAPTQRHHPADNHVQFFCLDPPVGGAGRGGGGGGATSRHAALVAAKEALSPKLQAADWEVLQWRLGSASDILAAGHHPHQAGAAADATATDTSTTLDQFMDNNRLAALQLLDLGPEADVAKILAGGQTSFGQRKVLLISFQYNSTETNLWSKDSLFKVVLQLYRNGYVCWMEGRDGKHARLSACWSERYAKVPVASVLCMHDSHVLRKQFEERSLLRHLKQARQGDANSDNNQ